MMVIGYGCGLGWFSPALPLLLSSDTPLVSGPLTKEQLSWSGSIVSIGSLAGNLLFGYFSVRIGTKRSLLVLFIPQLVFEIYIYERISYFFSYKKYSFISTDIMAAIDLWPGSRIHHPIKISNWSDWRRSSHLHRIILR